VGTKAHRFDNPQGASEQSGSNATKEYKFVWSRYERGRPLTIRVDQTKKGWIGTAKKRHVKQDCQPSMNYSRWQVTDVDVLKSRGQFSCRINSKITQSETPIRRYQVEQSAARSRVYPSFYAIALVVDINGCVEAQFICRWTLKHPRPIEEIRPWQNGVVAPRQCRASITGPTRVLSMWTMLHATTRFLASALCKIWSKTWSKYKRTNVCDAVQCLLWPTSSSVSACIGIGIGSSAKYIPEDPIWLCDG